jgi:hypothetical protein
MYLEQRVAPGRKIIAPDSSWIKSEIAVVLDGARINRRCAMSRPTADRSPKKDRRTFLKAGGIMTASVLGSIAGADLAGGQSGLASNPATSASMPTRNLGKTGHKVGIFSPGGQAALEKAENEANAVPITRRALNPVRLFGVGLGDHGGPIREESVLRRGRAGTEAENQSGETKSGTTHRTFPEHHDVRELRSVH